MERIEGFNQYVLKEARSLLNEIKKKTSTYAEARTELRMWKSGVTWQKNSDYSVVVAKAEALLNEEIDAINIIEHLSKDCI